ncbi:hypothetical protein DFJ73DRAFT_762010 [Zopfochytrium polystomum]|nr:hypothetical protein DFJ73DRAFT_762010 [Zopfochytrium polystomum]
MASSIVRRTPHLKRFRRHFVEIYGRRWVILIPAKCFLGFNIACTYSTNLIEMLIFRFLAVVGGRAPLSISAGGLSDIFKPGEIGIRMIGFSLAPSLEPVWFHHCRSLSRYNWRWTFHALSMIGAAVILLFLYGWTAQNTLHWILPDLHIFLFGWPRLLVG